MPALSVVVADIFDHRPPGLIARGETVLVDAFDLDGAVEGLHRRVVPAVAPAAQWTLHDAARSGWCGNRWRRTANHGPSGASGRRRAQAQGHPQPRQVRSCPWSAHRPPTILPANRSLINAQYASLRQFPHRSGRPAICGSAHRPRSHAPGRCAPRKRCFGRWSHPESPSDLACARAHASPAHPLVIAICPELRSSWCNFAAGRSSRCDVSGLPLSALPWLVRCLPRRTARCPPPGVEIAARRDFRTRHMAWPTRCRH